MSELEPLAVPEQLESLVVILRGQRVMLSPHLAPLYGIETKALTQAVKRNMERFPSDFMFQLTAEETENLKSQFVTSRLSPMDDNSQEGIPNFKSQSVTSNGGDAEETKGLRSQSVTSNRGGHRYLPYAFTEQGVAMLSSVLRSPRAVAVNIEIMRAFVRLRRLLAGHADLARRLDELEAQVKDGFAQSDQQFRVVFDAIRQLMTPSETKQGRIGFRREGEEE